MSKAGTCAPRRTGHLSPGDLCAASFPATDRQRQVCSWIQRGCGKSGERSPASGFTSPRRSAARCEVTRAGGAPCQEPFRSCQLILCLICQSDWLFVSWRAVPHPVSHLSSICLVSAPGTPANNGKNPCNEQE